MRHLLDRLYLLDRLRSMNGEDTAASVSHIIRVRALYSLDIPDPSDSDEAFVAAGFFHFGSISAFYAAWEV